MVMSILSGLKEVSPRCAKSVIPTSAVLSVALFCRATATVVDSVAASNIFVPLIWAQSERPTGQEGVVTEKGASTTALTGRTATISSMAGETGAFCGKVLPGTVSRK